MTLIELIRYQNTHTLFDTIFSITKEESANEVSVTNNKRDELLEKKENLRDSNVKVWCVCVSVVGEVLLLLSYVERTQTINQEMSQVRNEITEFEAKLDELKIGMLLYFVILLKLFITLFEIIIW